MTIRILGEDGKEVVEKPRVIKAEMTKAEEVAKTAQINFGHAIYLNRAGAFTLKLVAEDLATNQTFTFETPLKVSAP